MNSNTVTGTAGCLDLLLLAVALINYMQRYPWAHTVFSVGEHSQADISQADMSSHLGG